MAVNNVLQKIYRHSHFLVIASCLFILNSGSCLWAQAPNPPLERSVSISFQNKRTDEALKEISQQAGFTFSYSKNAFDAQQVINFNFKSTTIREVLETIFDGKVKYKQKNNYIILTRANKDDGVIVSGYVVDEATGQKLKEVSIYDPISLQSTVTDEFGYFQMEVKKPSKEEMQLAIKRNNYADKTIVVNSKRSSFQNLSLNIDEKKWQALSDSLDSKLNRLWSWTKQSVQRTNMRNIRDTLQRTWQVSFIPFVGTNHKMSGNVVNDYSLNILGGYSAGTRKAEFGGLFNINSGDVRYAQFAGLFNLNGGHTEGVQFAGLFNTNLGTTKAVQFAGLANVNMQASEGAQFAGLINFSNGLYDGPQFAGLFNLATADVKGAQVAGLFNFSPGKTDGAQIAGLFNVAEEVNGSQVSGLLNIAKNIRGTQVGFLNIADSVKGVPVGFLSFVNKGYHQLEIGADELFPVSAALRTGVTGFYNIFTASVRPEKADTTTWSFGYGLGVAPKLSKRIYLNTDITANHINKGNVEALNMINKFYLGFEFKFSKRFALAIGSTLNLRIYDAAFDNHAKLFTYHTPKILDEGTFSRNTDYQLWLGGKVGLRFF
jgi:hypothetical protein